MSTDLNIALDKFFWKRKASSVRYIENPKNISSYLEKKFSNPERIPQSVYLELYSMRDCTYGSEQFISLNTCIKRAAKRCDLPLICYFLRQGDPCYDLIIYYSILYECDEMMDLILDRYPMNYTCMVYGYCRKGDLPAVQLLMDHDVDISIALYNAGRGNAVDVIEYLISLKDGMAELEPALEGATRGQHRDLVINLLLHNPNRNKAIRIASQRGYREILYILTTGSMTDSTLYGACRGGQYDKVLECFERGALDAITSTYYAAIGGQKRIVKYLFGLIHQKNSMSPNEYQILLNLTLNNAAQSGSLDLVQYVISLGATNLCVALLTAIEHGKTSVIRYLLERGADNYHDAIFASVEYNQRDIWALLESFRNKFCDSR